MHRKSHTGIEGLTLVELLITIAVTSIALALAVPSWRAMVEKREVTTAAEGIASFFRFAQGEAVKRNESVTVAWNSPGSHNSGWCIGASMAPKATPCDCTETNTAANDFCSIDGAPYRLVQTDFVSANYELLHARPTASNLSFDPLRGIMTDIPTADEAEVLDGDYVFYVHSDTGSGSTRNFELQLMLNITGQISICTATDRKMLFAGYPKC